MAKTETIILILLRILKSCGNWYWILISRNLLRLAQLKLMEGAEKATLIYETELNVNTC